MQRERLGTIGQSLLEVLGSLTDPRSPHGKRHPLGAILGLAVCAMLSGARSLYAISQWGRDQGVGVSPSPGIHTGAHPPRLHLASGVQPAGPRVLRVDLGEMAGRTGPAGW